MKGAGLLGTGSYGCVMGPPVRCQGETDVNNNNAVVGKIFRSVKDFNKEKSRNKQISKIDPGNEFTLPVLGDCSVPIKNFTKEDEPEKCSWIATHGKRSLKQIMYKHGGVDITSMLKHVEDGGLWLDSLAPLMRPLFKGIAVMNEKRLVHFDIKIDNLMYNKYDAKFYIIDFGLLTPVAHVYTRDRFRAYWKYDYQWYPPEFKLFHLLRKDALSYYTVETFMNFFAPNMHYVRLEKLPNEVAALKEWFEYAKMHPVSATDIIKQSASKVDTYSLGIVMYIIVSKFKKYGKVRNAHLAERLMSLAHDMLRFDVRQRITADAALAKYDRIMAELQPSARPIPEKYQTKIDTVQTKPFEEMTVRELRAWCSNISVHSDGKKAELCDKLIKYST